MKPESPYAYYGRAIAYGRWERLEEAIESYRKFLQYAPPQDISAKKHAERRISTLSKRLQEKDRKGKD
jgi:tetratricopeptide (TPR) repeat protein